MSVNVSMMLKSWIFKTQLGVSKFSKADHHFYADQCYKNHLAQSRGYHLINWRHQAFHDWIKTWKAAWLIFGNEWYTNWKSENSINIFIIFLVEVGALILLFSICISDTLKKVLLQNNHITTITLKQWNEVITSR